MKIVVDLPDSYAREAGPFPFTAEDAAGYVVLWVERKDGTLRMCSTVGRDEMSLKEPEEQRGDAMMRVLEGMARRFREAFEDEMKIAERK
jgi:hypothetical protein